MQTNERLKMLLDATPEQLAAVDVALAGKTEPDRPSLRLYRIGEAARETGLSRQSIWRCVKEGRLSCVEIRKGHRRIPEDALRRFVGAE
jgi:excisionase family DNA binding protein